MPNERDNAPDATQLRWQRQLESSRAAAARPAAGLPGLPGGSGTGTTPNASAEANRGPATATQTGGASGVARSAASALTQKPGQRFQEAQAKGGSSVDQTLRMGGAAAAESAQQAGNAAGPVGKAFGAAAGEAATAGAEGAIAAKNALGGDMEAAKKSAAKIFKSEVIDKQVWPQFIYTFPLLQGYWLASIYGTDWTVPMRDEEHLIMFLTTAVEIFLVLLVLTIAGMFACLYDTTGCALNFSFSDLFFFRNFFSILL